VLRCASKQLAHKHLGMLRSDENGKLSPNRIPDDRLCSEFHLHIVRPSSACELPNTKLPLVAMMAASIHKHVTSRVGKFARTTLSVDDVQAEPQT
jgi:hypothetical protein